MSWLIRSDSKMRMAKWAVVCGASSYAGWYFTDTRSAIHGAVILPIIRAVMDPEYAHRLAVWSAEYGLVPRDRLPYDPRSVACLFGRPLLSPIGLAAGFDKDGRAAKGMFNMGFAAVEIGSVTPLPQPGNPQPRLFRSLKDGAVINSYGFNSAGHVAVQERLPKLSRHKSASEEKKSPGTLLGVNLGVNKGFKDECAAYVDGVRAFADRADYIAINVSSPNTAGLRDIQEKDRLSRLLSAVVKEAGGNIPIVVKISPDLSSSELRDVAKAVLECGVDGVIVANTTTTRPACVMNKEFAKHGGGLSGKPLFPTSLRAVHEMYALVGHKVPIIGCGGIATADDAIQMARAGASFVQLYTSLSLEGPNVIPTIKQGITEYLKNQDCKWTEIVGADHKKSS